MGFFGDVFGLYGKKKGKPKLFEHTIQGKFLKDLAKTGIYSPAVKRGLMGRMGSEAGGVAARRTAQSRGYLLSRGMTGDMGGTSIAAARLMDAPGRQVQRTLGRESLRIETENEMSKLRAEEELAIGKTRSREKRQAWREDFWGSAGRGLDRLGEDVAMAMMTGGTSEIPKTLALGGDRYMGMKRYQSDVELEKEWMRIQKMKATGGGGRTEGLWGPGGDETYNFQ